MSALTTIWDFLFGKPGEESEESEENNDRLLCDEDGEKEDNE